MTLFLTILGNAVCIFALISVHEVGHFLAGWLDGIPWNAMRIRLLTFPQHVLLRDGEDWVAPFDLSRYLPVMERHLGSGARLFLYAAGGLILETVFAVTASIVAKLGGRSDLALMIAGQSLGFYVILVFLVDLPIALYRGHACLDVSGLWSIARIPTVLLAVGLLLVRGLLVWYVIA
jgi:hypothetical protein